MTNRQGYLQNIRFYCELAKFKVAQPHTILHVYKVLIDDLTNANVECAALLLEGCGRFLLRSEETGERMKSMVRDQPLEVVNELDLH